MYNYKCPVCGEITTSSAPLVRIKCSKCGNEFEPLTPQAQNQYKGAYQKSVFDNGPSGRSRGLAGLLAIFLGSLGVHYFYCGKNTAGIIFLLVTLLSWGYLGIITVILSIITGVLMLSMSEQEFEEKYIYSLSTLPI